jgi:hypothetical protein
MKTYEHFIVEIFGLFKKKGFYGSSEIERMKKDSEERAKTTKKSEPVKHERGKAIRTTEKSQQEADRENNKPKDKYEPSPAMQAILKKAKKNRKQNDKKVDKVRKDERFERKMAQRQQKIDIKQQNADSFERNSHK